jgi:hypothetical protein
MTKGDRAAVLPPSFRCGSLLGTSSLRVVSGTIMDPHRTPHPMTNTCTWSMKVIADQNENVPRQCRTCRQFITSVLGC